MQCTTAPSDANFTGATQSAPTLPHPAARKRLAEIAQALKPAYDRAEATLECLMNPPFDETWTRKLHAAQDAYWEAVGVHVEEIAFLTNNGAAKLLSVFRPPRETMDLGGITPAVLQRMADSTGTWR